MKIERVFELVQARIGSAELFCCEGDQVRSKCRMSMQGIVGRKYILVDIDRVYENRPTETRCDFVLFLEGVNGALAVVPIELKNTRIEPSSVLRQLQAGSNYASRVVPSGVDCICIPVIVHGKTIHPQQLASLNKKKVRFHKENLTIRTVMCNRPKNILTAVSRWIRV